MFLVISYRNALTKIFGWIMVSTLTLVFRPFATQTPLRPRLCLGLNVLYFPFVKRPPVHRSDPIKEV
jgi:hypothetical protein